MRSLRNNMGLTVAVVSVILVSLVADTALAAVPKKINYQMRITDTDTGEPLPGPHDAIFRICNDGVTGGVIWTETHSVTADTAGVVSVILGSVTPIDISLDGQRWLEVEVDTEILSPRRELVSVPYALSAGTAGHAGNADSLGGVAASSIPTDGHSLDAADGDPVDAVYVNNYGRVGVGTPIPDHKLHVYDNQDLGTEIAIENVDPGSGGWQGLTFKDESGFTMGIQAREYDDPSYPSQMRLYNYRFEGDIRFNVGGYDHVVIDHNGNMGINAESPARDLHVNGEIQATTLYLGDSTYTGGFRMYQSSVDDPVVKIRADWMGGQIELYDSDGSDFAEFGPDGSASGGAYLQMRRNATQLGFVVDGNYNGTESPKMSITGASSAAHLDMSKIENQSVVLPYKSISSYETLDEPGVASIRTHYTSGTALQLQNGFNTLASKSITAPADGYVLALASAQPTITHSSPTNSQAEFGVSDAPGSFPENQDCMLMIDGENPSGVYTFPITVHGLFEVNAGTHTFYFLGREYSGTYTGNDVQFTLVYFASNHGSVDPTFASGEQAETVVENGGTVFNKAEEIALERAEEERAHRERVEREMAEMRAQIEALQREVEEGANSRRD